MCIDVLNSLKNSNGKSQSAISRKSNTGGEITKYLEFLEEKQYIGYRKPEKNETGSGPTKSLYYLKEKGTEFIRGWEEYRAKFDLDGLEKELSDI